MRRDPILWNIAADLKVNEELENARCFELPNTWLIPNNGEWSWQNIKIKNIDKKTSEIIYDELVRQLPKIPSALLSKLMRDLMKGLGESNKDGKGSKDGNGNEMDVPAKEVAGLEKEWQSRVNQANQNSGIGSIPAGLARELQELENPELPWHHIIRQRLSNIVRQRTWKRPAKKYLPLYFPGTRKEKGLNAVVALDTSGSMSKQDITKALSETLGLARSFPTVHLWVVANDAKVWDMIEVKPGNAELIRKIVPRGGGGTEFGPVFKVIKEKFNNKIDCLVFFTDGYCFDSWPKKPSYNTYWVTTSDDVKWPFGKEVKIKVYE